MIVYFSTVHKPQVTFVYKGNNCSLIDSLKRIIIGHCNCQRALKNEEKKHKNAAKVFTTEDWDFLHMFDNGCHKPQL